MTDLMMLDTVAARMTDGCRTLDAVVRLAREPAANDQRLKTGVAVDGGVFFS